MKMNIRSAIFMACILAPSTGLARDIPTCSNSDALAIIQRLMAKNNDEIANPDAPVRYTYAMSAIVTDRPTESSRGYYCSAQIEYTFIRDPRTMQHDLAVVMGTTPGSQFEQFAHGTWEINYKVVLTDDNEDVYVTIFNPKIAQLYIRLR
jgi:hypothetical protein